MLSDPILVALIGFAGVLVVALVTWRTATRKARTDEIAALLTKGERQDEQIDELREQLQETRSAVLIAERKALDCGGEKAELLRANNELTVQHQRDRAKIEDLEKGYGGRDLPEERIGWTS
jgi:hypothetical protein